ncbi:MAG TPA: hypothetical protein VMB85_11695 [Bryobacteraceae bacterium]|nr:hypothetical protein [Bryobacteraceae bacterium]
MPHIRFAAHPSEDTLEEYAFGRLREQDAAPLEEHLLLCSTCQDRLGEVEQYIRLIKTAASMEPRRTTAGWRIPTGVAALCVSAALALLLMIPRVPVEKTVQVDLIAFRGGVEMAHATAGRRLELTIDLSDLPPSPAYRVQVVDAAGREEWSGSAAASGVKLVVQVSKPLERGVHWVRLSSADDELLREFGLRAE